MHGISVWGLQIGVVRLLQHLDLCGKLVNCLRFMYSIYWVKSGRFASEAVSCALERSNLLFGTNFLPVYTIAGSFRMGSTPSSPATSIEKVPPALCTFCQFRYQSEDWLPSVLYLQHITRAQRLAIVRANAHFCTHTIEGLNAAYLM